MRTHSEYMTRLDSQRIADLQRRTAELERELSDARGSLERELAESAERAENSPGQVWEALDWSAEDADREREAFAPPAFSAGAETAPANGHATSGSYEQAADARTEVILNHGRHNSYRRRLSGRRIVVAGAAVAALVIILAIVLGTGGASWPASVATVQAEITRACQNPDVVSEPGQVNFACAQETRQILWVFALLTSGNDPNFSDGRTGRLGLEPITPSQGGVIAWSLNLHRPYSPFNPVDSIEVAARAINNIVGGATLTGANGHPVVQSGLEGSAANCLRYTGSAALRSRAGFPSLCAGAVASTAGQAELVADVYQKWIVGAAPRAAQDAALLFENSTNPGDPAVQAILTSLRAARR